MLISRLKLHRSRINWTGEKVLAALCWLAVFVSLASCGVTYQPSGATDYQIYAADREIKSAPRAELRALSMPQTIEIVSRVSKRIQPVARKICMGLGERSSSGCEGWQIKIANADEVNAYAQGRNEIILNRGLVEHTRNDDEVALVLGHEISHHMLNHNFETSVNRVTGSLLGGLIGGAIGVLIGDAIGIECDPSRQDCSYVDDFLDVFYEGGSDAGESFALRRFSREQEREADLFSVYLIKGAGYDLAKARGFVTTIGQLDASGDLRSTFSDTHPSGPERLAQFDLSVAEVGYVKKESPKPKAQQAYAMEGHKLSTIALGRALTNNLRNLGEGFEEVQVVPTSNVAGDYLVTGTVSSLEIRDRVIELVNKDLRVENVHNHLSVGLAFTDMEKQRDSVLAKQVNNKLKTVDRVKAEDIKFQVNDSTVFLMGHVEKSLADTAVASVVQVSGVSKIVRIFHYTGN